MVLLEQVSKFIIKDLNLHIPKGEIVGIIGASGAGKTTLLKLISGLLESETGSVHTLRMDPIRDRKKLTGEIGTLFADKAVLDMESPVRENLENAGVIYGIKKEEFEERYQKLSKTLGFEAYGRELPVKLSLGQRRRAELAFVFLPETKLLCLDEPCIGLDQLGKKAVMELALDKKKNKTTVLISSHDMEEIDHMCDRILLIHQGKKIFYGPKEELLRRFAPVDVLQMDYTGDIPSLADLPIEWYDIENGHLEMAYDSNHVTAKEVLEILSEKEGIKNISIRHARLEDTIRTIMKVKAEQT